MKIAFITSGLLPIPASKGGAIETLLDSFIKENESNNKNIEIVVYSIYDKDAKKISRDLNYKKTKYKYINSFSNFVIRVINKLLKKNVPINLVYQKLILKKINKEKYDYVIVENYPELVLNIKNQKVIPYIHSDVFNVGTENSLNILSKSYKVITVSNFIRNRVVEIDKTQANKVYVVYNSIDFKQISIDEQKNIRKLIRDKYNIDNNDFVYAFSGRLSKEKGVLECLKAFNKISVPQKKLLIIGGIWYGSKKKNDYLSELEKNSDNNVIYTGYVKHNEMQNILYSIDVGVVPSICNEAAGLSVVEFMNTNNLVVASNMGGISEYLNIDDNFLVDFRNEEQYINDLALGMEESYNKLNNDEIVKEKNYLYSKKFSVEENYKNIINVLESEL